MRYLFLFFLLVGPFNPIFDFARTDIPKLSVRVPGAIAKGVSRTDSVSTSQYASPDSHRDSISSSQNATRSEEEARQLADSLYNALLKGADFSKLASAFSEDPGTKNKGGMIMNCKKGQFVPEFEEAVLKQDVGGITPPFKTQYGYHIAQLMTRNGDTFSVRHILITYKE